MKDFLSLSDLSSDQVRGLLDLAGDLRARLESGAPPRPLQGQILAMLFAKPSLRTRVSFDVGMRQLGGEALYLSPAEIGLGSRESAADVARVLSRYVDGIMARVFAHADVEALALHASVPVINGLSDLSHPCQGLADLLTIRDGLGRLEGVRLTYVGDGNNVAHSLLHGGAKVGMHVRIIHPPGYAPDEAQLKAARTAAEATGGSCEATEHIDAVEGADVLYTDVWASMGQEDEAARRKAAFEPYRLDEALLARAGADAIVLHCLPAHRGDEITDGVMDGSQSRVFDQAENRMHAQKALLAWLLGGMPLPA